MIVHAPTFALRSTRHRVDFFRRELARHPDSLPPAEFEDFVANFSGGVDELFALDLAVRTESLDATDDCDSEIFAQLEVAVADWHTLAINLQTVAPTTAADGKAQCKLRAIIADLEAALHPSRAMNELMDRLCDEAIAEYDAGGSVAGLLN